MKTDNELIAEFMGLKSREVGPLEHRHKVWYKDDPEQWFSFPEYGTSWNSLMPVVKKIEQELSEFSNKDNSWLYWHNVFDGFVSTKITNAFDTVVEFIKWYNQQPKQ